MTSKAIRGATASLEKPLIDDLDALSCADEQRTALKAACGIEGFVQQQLMSDLRHESRRVRTLGFALKRRAKAEMRLFEVFEPLGVTSAASPMLWIRTMIAHAKKLVKAVGAEGVVAPYIRIGVDKRQPGPRSIYLLTGRAVVFAKEDFDWDAAERRIDALRPGGRKHLKLPVELTKVPPDWDDINVANWLIGIPTSPIILSDSGKGFQVRERRAGYKGGQLSRLAEALSTLVFSTALAGVGVSGQGIAKQVITKMSAWQKSRLDRGTIVQDAMEIWSAWAGARMMASGSKFLPLRSDIGPKPPKLLKSKTKVPLESKYNPKDRKGRRRGVQGQTG